ncbi:hypothetical protein J7J90_00975 [Candidatus Micrarchaeota archaeon]|nr:hypothetical protein [Candidatus Micrarchaeota archaeon]
MEVNISTRLYPLRMIAYSHNSVDVTFTINNMTNEMLWLECDIKTPETLSLSKSDRICKGRFRFGIIGPKNIIEKTIKIYGNVATYPDVYNVKTTIKVFDRFGKERNNIDHKFNVRCIPQSDIKNDNY